ncbi:hypothetical protein [Parasphingopyxis sp.]|uniref:hypothetical protein n=1 Tax=Parasphingopyxis sp. TaxID=1920299 RepID=UPI00260EA7C0|nr:hypothetical protein [Parasphingopyxis sp.]
MTTIRTAALMAALSLPIAAQAQPTGFEDCEDAWPAQLQNLAIGENGEGIRTFYNGAVTLLQIDTIEPAAGSGGIIVMMWTGSELSDIERHCWVTAGHGGIDVDATESSYDPAEGLTLSVPTRSYSQEDGSLIEGTLRFRLNVAAGTLTPLP